MYVVAAVLTIVAVVGSWMGGGSKNLAAAPSPTTDAWILPDDTLAPQDSSPVGSNSVDSAAPTTVTGDSTADIGAPTDSGPLPIDTTSAPPADSAAPPPNDTGPPQSGPTQTGAPTASLPAGDPNATPTTAAIGTAANVAEVDRVGDDPNPGARFPDRPDIRPKDQERLVGPDAQPARLSGFSAWIVSGSVEAVGPDQAPGPFIKITVHLINRDDRPQDVDDSQWELLRPDGLAVPSTYSTPTIVNSAKLAANGELYAEVWFAAPVSGGYWLSFRPDEGSPRGVWGLRVTLPSPAAAAVAPTTTVAPVK
jgi:hypothetical protein